MGGSGSGNRTPSIRPVRTRRLRADGSVVSDSGPPPDPEVEQDEQDLLKLARRDFKKYGAVTREDRVALASRFVRHSDPMIALQYSKLLEQMERGADSAETGLPAPTVEGDGTANDQAQDYRLSRMMSMTGKATTDRAYEMFLSEWRERETQKTGRFRSSLPTEPGDAVAETAATGNGRGVDEAVGEGGGVTADEMDEWAKISAEPAAAEVNGDEAGVSELRGTEEDHSPAAGAQSEVAAGSGDAATEDRAGPEGNGSGGGAVAPEPVVAPVRVPWNPNYDGVKYMEDEDGDPE